MNRITFERKPKILARLGIRNSAFYSRIQKGLFPPPIHLSGGRVSLWATHEVEAVSAAILAGQTDEQVQRLVQQLVADRQTAGRAA